MANRLPRTGEDNGVWGQILNDYLSVELNADGTLKKAGAITAAQAAADAAQTTANAAIPSSQKGAASGVASLDSSTKLTASQLPTTAVTKSTNSGDTGKAIDAYTGSPLTVMSAAGLSGAVDGQDTSVASGALVAHNPLYIDPSQAPYNVKFDRFSTTQASMSSSTNPTQLTLGDYAFVSTDIGKAVKVIGAAASGANLKTTITGVTAGKAILALPCLTTVSGAFCLFGTDNATALNLLFTDLSKTTRVRALSRIAVMPQGVAMYSGTLLLPCRGTLEGSAKNWINYDLMYSRFGGAENVQGTILYQMWDQNVDCARVRPVATTQYDWDGSLTGFTIEQDLDNTTGRGIVFRDLADNPVKVIDGGVISRVAVMGTALEGWHFAGGSITAVFRDLQAFACGWNGRKTFTANTTSGSLTISSVSDFTGLAYGDILSGPGIPTDATIQSLNSGAGTLTISRAATATLTATNVERLGSPGVLYNVNSVDLPHFDGLSGDQNSGGLLRLKGAGSTSEAAVVITNLKNEFGVNVYRGGPYNASTPSIPQGRNAIVLDGMVNTPVTVRGLIHWADGNSSVGSSLPNSLGMDVGAAILSIPTSVAPDVTWEGLRVHLAAGQGQTERIAFRDNWSASYYAIDADTTGKGTNKRKPASFKTFADVNATLGIHDVTAAWTSLTATRTAQLPGIADLPIGYEVVIMDVSGQADTIKRITGTPKGSDTIVGSTQVASAYGSVSFISNGTLWIGSARTAVTNQLVSQLFTASGTFTAPTAGQYRLSAWGGGGGGGGGGAAALTGGTATQVGGAGGGAGAFAESIVTLSAGDTVAVTVGAGGAGGTGGVASTDASGRAASGSAVGGNTVVGSLTAAGGGLGGNGAANSASTVSCGVYGGGPTGASTGSSNFVGSGGTASSTAGGIGGAGISFSGRGGGGGAPANTTLGGSAGTGQFITGHTGTTTGGSAVAAAANSGQGGDGGGGGAPGGAGGNGGNGGSGGAVITRIS